MILVPLGSRMKGSDGDVLSGSYRMRRISLMFGVFASLMVLSVLVSSYPLARKTKTIRDLPFHGSTIFWVFEKNVHLNMCRSAAVWEWYPLRSRPSHETKDED